MNRRTLLWNAGALALVGCEGPAAMDPDGHLVGPDGIPLCPDPFAGGQFLGVLPFVGEVQEHPFGELSGEGWDARLRFDLSTLDEGALVVPNALFYVRTERPDLLDTSDEAWVIRVRGLVGADVDLPLDELRPLVADQGVVLLECSGNTIAGSFGLMSAAAWAGVPLLDVLDLVDVRPEATRVLVSGFDGHSVPSSGGHSAPGAAWIFSFEELAATGAFLALEMNGEPLPDDHGRPVRLVVPGWYGCTCIKWVDELRLVGDDEPATSQMLEFADRTHQDGAPALARDYRPASIQQAAMPVRVEKWLLNDRFAYRVVGVLWGGEAPVGDALRFSDGDVETPVTLCTPHVPGRTWSLWVHRWEPSRLGEHTLHLRIDDPAIPTLRLDLGWYDRVVSV